MPLNAYGHKLGVKYSYDVVYRIFIKMIKQIHKILNNTITGIIVLSITLMYFVYSFNCISLEFYLAIIQAIVMELSIKWFFRKFEKNKV